MTCCHPEGVAPLASRKPPGAARRSVARNSRSPAIAMAPVRSLRDECSTGQGDENTPGPRRPADPEARQADHRGQLCGAAGAVGQEDCRPLGPVSQGDPGALKHAGRISGLLCRRGGRATAGIQILSVTSRYGPRHPDDVSRTRRGVPRGQAMCPWATTGTFV